MKSSFTKTVLLLAGMVMLIALPASAQKGLGNSTGIAREGIHPEVSVIKGDLDHIKTGPCENTTGHAFIGTHLFLKTGESETLINIHLGPADAVESFVNDLEPGQSVEVRVFRTEEMGPGVYIAKEVTANGHTLQLRDENLRPFWAGQPGFRK